MCGVDKHCASANFGMLVPLACLQLAMLREVVELTCCARNKFPLACLHQHANLTPVALATACLRPLYHPQVAPAHTHLRLHVSIITS